MRNNLIKQKKPSEIKEEFHGVNKSPDKIGGK